jgi:putative hydrolase of the HAD superfamily
MKTLFFDLLGVIFPNKCGLDEQNTMNLYKYINSDMNYEEFREKFYNFTKSKISRKEFWNNEPEKYKEVESAYLNGYEIYVGIGGILKQLQPNFRLSVISNHPQSWVDYLLQRHDLKNYFEKVFTSANTGYRKPAVEIFEIACDKFGTNPADSYMIDDQNVNLIGAKKAGIKTIHVNVFNDKTQFNPDYEIIKLEELIDLADSLNNS